ncbi:fungal transcriptional regulatory protein, partial [Thelonectria olida]
KLPACDPCRASKLACDHGQPVCIRCRDANRSGQCKYRESPFKRERGWRPSTLQMAMKGTQRVTKVIDSPQRGSARPSERDINVEGMVTKPHKYPNPGWLGTSSHTTLFDHLPGAEDESTSDIAPGSDQERNVGSEHVVSNANVAHGAKVVEQIRRLLSPSSCSTILDAWMSKDASLALAGVFVEPCAKAVKHLLSDHDANPANAVEIASKLFANSCRPLSAAPDETIDNYSAQFCQQNARWETVGLFCTAVSRAVTDLTYSETFCDSDQERRDLQRLTMHFSDVCLNTAASLDCLNDLQLLLQYENFILHSMVDGDQSYHSWKRLGNMTSSLFALGYHQQLERNPGAPTFLTDLRRAAFARAYSADKNVSIFLGRPPRIHRKYCHFYLPGHDIEITQDVTYDYVFETGWTALCAVLKEEILDLFDAAASEDRDQKAEQANLAQWTALPSKFRLEGPLKLCSPQPVMRDFLVSARLNHLHILFLLCLAVARSKPQFDADLAAVSAEILGIVAEAIMLKGQLSNSGTSLVWKVAYYGLSAAGVMYLWLLSQSPETRNYRINRAKVTQNLSVLVLEIETGTLVQTDDSNYGLLMGASQTIGNMLDRLLHDGIAPQTVGGPYQNASLLGLQSQIGWNPWDGATWQDFETDFWLNLAEHPFILG